MEWTTDKPTEGGLYWACSDGTVVPVDAYFAGHKLLFFELGENYGDALEAEDFDYFMGPLPMPDPPKEPV